VIAIIGWLQGPHKAVPAGRFSPDMESTPCPLQVPAMVSISSSSGEVKGAVTGIFITPVIMLVMALAPSSPVSVLVLIGCPAQFSPRWDGIGSRVHQELGITHAILTGHCPHPPSQQPSLYQNHFFLHDRMCVCVEDCTHRCAEPHVLVNKFWLELL